MIHGMIIGKQLAAKARVIHVRLPDLVNGSAANDLLKEVDGMIQLCYQMHEERGGQYC
jgi:hypothetical protein